MSLDSLVGYMMFSVIISVVTLVLAIAYGVVIYFAIRKTRELLLEIHSSSKQSFEIVQRVEQRSEVLDTVDLRLQAIERQLKELKEAVSNQFHETKTNLSEIGISLDDTMNRVGEVDSKFIRLSQILEQYKETLKELLELKTEASDLVSQTEMLKVEIQRLRDVLNEPLDLSEWVDGNGTSKE
ncbi:MAG: hypothetical protein ACUVQF_05955 [Fervidobacterium sp.]|uniref:hypothetical protein n=1 Tax=Fervidobacterium sp. TaxID=1871331 RepID=UPI00404AB9E5